jgi:hypothetical protein
LYEFASTGRPVVVMNAPQYRRDVHHGLRFWDYPPGLQVDRPEQLADTIARALSDPEPARALRAAAVAETYAYTDGRAAPQSTRYSQRELLPGERMAQGDSQRNTVPARPLPPTHARVGCPTGRARSGRRRLGTQP